MMTLFSVAYHLPRTSRKWRRGIRQRVHELFKDNLYLGLWQLQAKAVTPAMLALLATQEWWQTFLVLCFWALFAALIYEVALLLGVNDFLEVDRKALTAPINYGIRLVIFGWKALALRIYHDRGAINFRVPVHMLTLLGVGVIATHYHFRRAGFSQREVFALNLFGRVTSVLFTVTIGSVVWHFTGDYVTWVWMQLFWPILWIWSRVEPYAPILILGAIATALGLIVLDKVLETIDGTETEVADETSYTG